MTTRPGEIKQWLTTIFPNIDLSSLKYIQADASDRKYLRLSLTELSFIIMDAKPGPELNRFIKIAEILSQHQVNVPQIIATDLPSGLILMTDFGTDTYLSVLQHATEPAINNLYRDALTSLIKIQSIAKGSNAHQLPLMGAEYINDRLNVFKTWYLEKHLQLEIDAEINQLIHSMQKLFTDVFQEQTQVFVHLDYHCRNLMYLPYGNNPGVLDFQDAMFGPITYDLVSLFQDAYITWPREKVESWILDYSNMAYAAGLINKIDLQQMLRHFDMVGLQRHIKNLGVFARLHHRDNKSNYLNDIPTLLEYIIDTCNRYPELSMLLEFLNKVTVQLVTAN